MQKNDWQWIIRLFITIILLMQLGVQFYKQNIMATIGIGIFSILGIYTTLVYYHGIKTIQEHEQHDYNQNQEGNI